MSLQQTVDEEIKALENEKAGKVGQVTLLQMRIAYIDERCKGALLDEGDARPARRVERRAELRTCMRTIRFGSGRRICLVLFWWWRVRDVGTG